MKATGIVRRIDDLGRIVIPKEIRRTLRIREGEPLEIFTETDGSVIFRKYSPVGELGETAEQFSEVLYKTSGLPIVICDKDHVIATAGFSKKEISERRISQELDEIAESRRLYEYKSSDRKPVKPIEGYDGTAVAISPIVASGDLYGSVIMMNREGKEVYPSETEIKMILLVSGFLGKQLEE